MPRTSRLEYVGFAGLVALAVLIALAEPTPLMQRAIDEHTASTGTVYRIERQWRRVADEEIAGQVERELAAFRGLRAPPLHTKGTWWLARTWEENRIRVRDWFAEQRHRAELTGLYRTMPTNWYLSDLGIARNGAPLPLPAGLADSLWHHHAQRDRYDRVWAGYFISAPTDAFGGEITFADDLDERFTRQIADASVSAFSGLISNGLSMTAVSIDTQGAMEALFIAPYLLLFHDGALVGVLGGDGRFDRIPDDWDYLRP